MQQTRKKVFIGCSSNALPVADEVKNIVGLNFNYFDVEVWNETDWKNLVSVLDNLIEKIEEYHYAIFIGYPDDTMKSGGDTFLITRDNVIFEFGLFLSRLNKDRTFLLIPELISTMTYPFRLLSDIGDSVVVDKYKLVSQNQSWVAEGLKEDLKKLIKKIHFEEKRLNDLNIQTGKKLKTISSTIYSALEEEGKSDEFYISIFRNCIEELVRLISIETNRKVNETIEDILLVSTNIDDILNTKQLAVKQSYKSKICEVWVFADAPLEFLNPDLPELKVLQDTIVENLTHGVIYHYFVNSKFPDSAVEEFLRGFPKSSELIKNIFIHKIDSKYFKTYFTLHFLEGRKLSEIYLSALMQNRKDLLIKVSKTFVVV